MPLKKHHKIMIGSFSSLLVVLLITNSIFIYILYGQLQASYNQLESEIQESQADTQSKLNDLAESLIQTNSDVASIEIGLESVDIQLSSIGEEFDELKASTSADFSGIIEDAIKGVVTIKTDVSQGTGFLITSDGYIVTNAHVLSGASKVYAITYDQTELAASFIGYDSDMDLALLKITGSYEELELADSDDITIGEKVIAIGNPFGLQFSVSEGIISGIHREGPNGLEAYIQTDAALNSGNSGGPLIDTSGEVIGINNFKLSDGESLGFALESNYIEEIVNEIAQQAIGQELI